MNSLGIAKVLRLFRHLTYNSLFGRRLLVWDLNVAVINRCNQSCPMCNATILNQRNTKILTISKFRNYTAQLMALNIPTCTISGGEPTLAPDLPEIIAEAHKIFPVNVTVISNLYSPWRKIRPSIEEILRRNLHLVCSFDGFGNTVDDIRGSKQTAKRVIENQQKINELRRRIASNAVLEMHMVISDHNVGQINQVLEHSRDLNWLMTVAPVNPMPQSDEQAIPYMLSSSDKLESSIELLAGSRRVSQMSTFLRGIPAYAAGKHEKKCPYLTRHLKYLKIFLEPDGSVSLCDRKSIGNLSSESISKILKSAAYREYLERARTCNGCWLSCFTEPVLATERNNYFNALQKRVFRRPVSLAQERHENPGEYQ